MGVASVIGVYVVTWCNVKKMNETGRLDRAVAAAY